MARIRTIKPEFFTSEDIVGLSPLARLLYIAIWCEADKEGRMEWKPNTFKLRYLPGDVCDVHALCAELVNAGLVRLYGDGCAVIPKFRAHQHINPRESDSRLPDPDALPPVHDRKLTRAPRVPNASPREDDAQGGREGKGKEGVIEPYGSVAGNPPTPPPPDPPPGASPLPRCPVDTFIDLYHEVLPELPRVKLRDSIKRKKLIASFWRWVLSSKKSDGSPRATSGEEALAWCRSYFVRARDSDFLMGRSTPSPGHETWRCDLDFLLTENGKKHVIEKTGGTP